MRKCLCDRGPYPTPEALKLTLQQAIQACYVAVRVPRYLCWRRGKCLRHGREQGSPPGTKPAGWEWLPLAQAGLESVGLDLQGCRSWGAPANWGNSQTGYAQLWRHNGLMTFGSSLPKYSLVWKFKRVTHCNPRPHLTNILAFQSFPPLPTSNIVARGQLAFSGRELISFCVSDSELVLDPFCKPLFGKFRSSMPAPPPRPRPKAVVDRGRDLPFLSYV